jgi:hypothetical protein
MKFSIIGRLAGAVGLTVMLAGCFDISMDIEVLSETTARAEVMTTIGADIYPMLKAGGGEGSSDFCKEEGDVLTENEDGSATCAQVKEGTFADLDLQEEDGAKFEVVSPGVVRASFSTKEMQGDLAESAGGAAGEEMDEETKAMMATYFEGHNITLKISGKKIVESNMTISADGTSAEQIIPLIDLMNGTSTLPEEIYAVVDTN